MMPRLIVVYQPIVSLADGGTIAAEALVRGECRGTSLGAREVLALARATPNGMAVLTGQVVRLACLAAAQSDSLLVHVNLDPDMLLANPETVTALVAQGLRDADLPAKRLVVELTEHPDDEDAVMAALQPLLDLGVGLGLDDVGAGGADWHRLARLPADVVKVDRSVLLDAAASERGRAVLASLVQLLAELDVACVVEGVETAEQVALLEELLVLHPGLAGQGWHFGRPSPMFPVPASAEMSTSRRHIEGRTLQE